MGQDQFPLFPRWNRLTCQGIDYLGLDEIIHQVQSSLKPAAPGDGHAESHAIGVNNPEVAPEPRPHFIRIALHRGKGLPADK